MVITTQYAAAIVGAGPIGLELAAALKQLEIPYVQFDKNQAGQMIYDFPPALRFFSSSERIAIAGIPINSTDQQKCTREEYLAYLRTVVGTYQLKINSYEEVVRIKRIDKGFLLQTKTAEGQWEYRVQYIILATGGTSSPRLLDVPGESLPHVAAKLEDPHKYFQKRVLVIGSKNSAVESALRCFHAGASVAIALRRKEFDPKEVKYWLLPELLGHITRKDIACHYGVEVKEIFPGKVLLRSTEGGLNITAETDFVIKAIGFHANMNLFGSLGVALSPDDNAPAFNPSTMETDVPGVYAAGTVIAGTQKTFKVFLENCHEHVDKIARDLCIKLGMRDKWEQLPHFLNNYRPEGKALEE